MDFCNSEGAWKGTLKTFFAYHSLLSHSHARHLACRQHCRCCVQAAINADGTWLLHTCAWDVAPAHMNMRKHGGAALSHVWHRGLETMRITYTAGVRRPHAHACALRCMRHAALVYVNKECPTEPDHCAALW